MEFKTSITPSDNCACSDPECSDPLAAWPNVPYSASGCSEARETWACSRNHNRHQHPASIHVDSLHMMWCIPGTGAQGGSAFLRFALIVSRRQGQRAASTGTSSDLRGSSYLANKLDVLPSGVPLHGLGVQPGHSIPFPFASGAGVAVDERS